MSILTFQIDPQYDADMVFTMLNQNSAHDAAFRAKDMKLAGNLIDRIQSVSDYGEVKAVIMQTVADRHAEVKAQLENAVITYQASWDKIDGAFFARLVELFPFPCPHPQYICVVSAFHFGISNWGGYTVARIYNLDPDEQRRITAHEIIISYFFSYIFASYPKFNDKHRIWEAAEIIAFALTGLDPVLTKFWPWDTSGAYTDHNYPEIALKQDQLVSVYIKEGLDKFINIACS